MKIFTYMAWILAVANGIIPLFDVINKEWKMFMLLHRKSFQSVAEENDHIKVYIENQMRIALHNEKYAMGLVPYSLNGNDFTDILASVFAHAMNGFNISLAQHFPAKGITRTFDSPENVTVPDHVDWRKAGAVTPVKEQGKCRACWSFSAAGAVEGQHFRKTGVLVSLSEQNLIDCSTSYGNNGCNGGHMDNAFQYVKENGDIDTESSYPYEAVTGTCRHESQNSGTNNVALVRIPIGDEKKLKEAIATVGPVSAAIDASRRSFQFYSDGVYHDELCSSTNLDHGVLVVGYGTDEKGGDYWLIKNSWGRSWGQDGYIKMARNVNNHCGVATAASYLQI